ncbi:hypothetical protein WA158_001062 [Blastocystis sp. Blastoise]
MEPNKGEYPRRHSLEIIPEETHIPDKMNSDSILNTCKKKKLSSGSQKDMSLTPYDELSSLSLSVSLDDSFCSASKILDYDKEINKSMDIDDTSQLGDENDDCPLSQKTTHIVFDRQQLLKTPDVFYCSQLSQDTSMLMPTPPVQTDYRIKRLSIFNPQPYEMSPLVFANANGNYSSLGPLPLSLKHTTPSFKSPIVTPPYIKSSSSPKRFQTIDLSKLPPSDKGNHVNNHTVDDITSNISKNQNEKSSVVNPQEHPNRSFTVDYYPKSSPSSSSSISPSPSKSSTLSIPTTTLPSPHNRISFDTTISLTMNNNNQKTVTPPPIDTTTPHILSNSNRINEVSELSMSYRHLTMSSTSDTQDSIEKQDETYKEYVNNMNSMKSKVEGRSSFPSLSSSFPYTPQKINLVSPEDLSRTSLLPKSTSTTITNANNNKILNSIENSSLSITSLSSIRSNPLSIPFSPVISYPSTTFTEITLINAESGMKASRHEAVCHVFNRIYKQMKETRFLSFSQPLNIIEQTPAKKLDEISIQFSKSRLLHKPSSKSKCTSFRDKHILSPNLSSLSSSIHLLSSTTSVDNEINTTSKDISIDSNNTSKTSLLTDLSHSSTNPFISSSSTFISKKTISLFDEENSSQYHSKRVHISDTSNDINAINHILENNPKNDFMNVHRFSFERDSLDKDNNGNRMSIELDLNPRKTSDIDINDYSIYHNTYPSKPN